MLTALGNVTQQNWENAVQHVYNFEDAFRRIDFVEEATASHAS